MIPVTERAVRAGEMTPRRFLPDASARVRLLRYVVVGLACFAIDYALTALAAAHLPLVLANSIGFLVANAANFLLGHYWVFAHARHRRSHAGAYLSVLVISLVGLALNDLIVVLAVQGASLALLPAKVVATGLVFAWNFWARARFTYAPAAGRRA